MVQRYFKNEFTASQWRKLVDEALALHCVITYNKYGTIAEIDSTPLEDRLIRKESDRLTWAEHIHTRIYKATF